jgi:enolase
MNHGAENAVSKAAPIFLNAITSMTFADAKNILKGADNAATEYFKGKTTTALFGLFKPEIQKALDAVNATKYWSDITSTYNKIPFVTKIETDLAKYVTDKALTALFTQIASEEKKIRTDPLARVNDILKKVFNPNAVIQ